MRCSICDTQNTQFVFENWHCSKCVAIIKSTLAEFSEEDNDNYLSVWADDILNGTIVLPINLPHEDGD